MKSHSSHPETLLLVYVRSSAFSGQRAATEVLSRGLSQRGWNCEMLSLPSMAAGRRFVSYAVYLRGLIASWVKIFVALLVRAPSGAMMHISLGQTWASFFRDAVPIVLCRVLFGRGRLVISLHGSNFMGWSEGSLKNRTFLLLLRPAWRVTVLGKRQRARLLGQGFPLKKVVIMINTCDFHSSDVSTDWSEIAFPSADVAARRPVRVLFLSSLIDTKGFPLYMEALLELSRHQPAKSVEIDAVLCGTFVSSEFAARFTTAEAAEKWIIEISGRINESSGINVRWVRGARGEAKLTLFREADIFVLPTQYAVEAQPLVLLEAMATGCAIITTRIGEIESILSSDVAVLLEDVNVANLSSAIGALVRDEDTRHSMAQRAWRRYHENYDLARHIDNWVRLLDGRESLRGVEVV